MVLAVVVDVDVEVVVMVVVVVEVVVAVVVVHPDCTKASSLELANGSHTQDCGSAEKAEVRKVCGMEEGQRKAPRSMRPG